MTFKPRAGGYIIRCDGQRHGATYFWGRLGGENGIPTWGPNREQASRFTTRRSADQEAARLRRQALKGEKVRVEPWAS